MGHFGPKWMAWRRNNSVYSQVAMTLGVALGITQAFSELTVSENSGVDRHEGKERHRSLVRQITLHSSFQIFRLSNFCLMSRSLSLIVCVLQEAGTMRVIHCRRKNPSANTWPAHGRHSSPEVGMIVKRNKQVQEFLFSQKAYGHKVRGRQPNLGSKM